MKKVLRKLLSAAVGLAVLAIMSTANSADVTKVGFVYVGPIGDHGWTYEHNQSRLAIEKEFGGKVKTTFLEKVPEGTDAERAIQQLARAGHDIIFTTSFGFMNPTIKVAKKFPNIKFEHATGFKRAKNVSTYSARFYEGRHVIGLIAGKMTKTNTIGYIASFPIPEVVRGINAAYLAANYNRKGKILVTPSKDIYNKYKNLKTFSPISDLISFKILLIVLFLNILKINIVPY